MREADNLPPSCAVVTKSGNLNFLEPSEPVQACNGTDLPLPFFIDTNIDVDINIDIDIDIDVDINIDIDIDIDVDINIDIDIIC